jgi:ectoine hydroxylase-related dioxygenase (phytanoyl-CoA dioxygenase family)
MTTGTHSALRRQLEEQGYVVVPNVLPKENLEAVLSDIWTHTGARPDDRESWYRPDRIRYAGMIEMYHYQSMWNNRQHPNVHQVFSDIFGTEKLWVSLDRTNLKPPADDRYPDFNPAGFMHWDTAIEKYPDIPFSVQGVLALTDTDESMGGFQCVPELYQNLAEWLARRPEDQKANNKPDLTGCSITKVPAKAGDMIIWHVLLPHGNGYNASDRPRLAQYITMSLAQEQNTALREERVNCWRTNTPPPSRYFPGDPRKIEEQRPPAQLTPLGRKLIGLDSWD